MVESGHQTEHGPAHEGDDSAGDWGPPKNYPYWASIGIVLALIALGCALSRKVDPFAAKQESTSSKAAGASESQTGRGESKSLRESLKDAGKRVAKDLAKRAVDKLTGSADRAPTKSPDSPDSPDSNDSSESNDSNDSNDSSESNESSDKPSTAQSSSWFVWGGIPSDGWGIAMFVSAFLAVIASVGGFVRREPWRVCLTAIVLAFAALAWQQIYVYGAIAIVIFVLLHFIA